MLPIAEPQPGEDVFGFIRRQRGRYDAGLYARILGAANAFKEGDAIVGVAAADEASRRNARALLANTRLADIDAQPLHADGLFQFISAGPSEHARETISESNVQAGKRPADQTLDQLKHLLLTSDETEIKALMPSLSSDVIACVVKLMSDDALVEIGRKVFNPLPGSRIGARGYLGARIQPNSPTDNVDDIRWQVFDGWSYAVGDVLLGTNPVSSDPESVAAIERTLQDVLATFGVDQRMPHCVLAHIDVQAQVECEWPGSTALWFQSIAGSDAANATFGIGVDAMVRYADARSGRYGLYFETGQGADFTNGHGHGYDMLIHEARKYGFARALAERVARARRAAESEDEAGSAVDGGGETAAEGAGAWVHANDVAGFIGPEVFRTREQLVRCCLEDIAMGKLHGLCIGLDVCSTLHMDVSLDDLDWCLERILPANPAYLMALPTKIDPMLGYLTTGYQDHVRLRERFGYRVNDPMWAFFQQLGVVDSDGRPTEHFGDPCWVFLQYRRHKGDGRSGAEILEDGRRELAEVRSRGVFVAEGHGARPWDLKPELQRDIRRVYDDAKRSIWAELAPEFIEAIPAVERLATQSADREDFILHPETGERLDEPSVAALHHLRRRQAGRFAVQILISDGLNALSIMEDGHLEPFLAQLRGELEARGLSIAPEHLVLTSGRVRAGYRVGEVIFAHLDGPRAIAHLIGERPGSGHRTFSAYLSAATGDAWGKVGSVDHDITKVVSGIAATALEPEAAAAEAARLLGAMLTPRA